MVHHFRTVSFALATTFRTFSDWGNDFDKTIFEDVLD